jgi:hypothetical protein
MAGIMVAQRALTFRTKTHGRTKRKQKERPRRKAGAAKPYRCHHAKAPAQGGKAGNDSLAAIIHQLL